MARHEVIIHMMGVFFGLLTALGWGVGDFLSGTASRAVGSYRAFFYMQGFSTGLLALWIAGAVSFGIFVAPPHATIGSVVWAVGLGILELVAWLLLLRSFAIGTISVVAPIVASLGAVALVLSLLWGDHIGLLKLAGLSATVVGIGLASIRSQQPEPKTMYVGAVGVSTTSASSVVRKNLSSLSLQRLTTPLGPGVLEALGSAIGFGITLWGQRFVVPDLGPYWASEVVTVTAWVLLVPLAWRLREPLTSPGRSQIGRLLLMAGCYTIAGVTFNLGIGSDSAGVVAVIGSLSSPVTVLLALLLLKERLTLLQWGGVGMTIVGLVLIA